MARPDKEKKKLKDKAETAPWFDISQETRNSIYGIASFIVAIISVLAFLNAAGTAGNVIGYWGFNQRAGFRWVAVPDGEMIVGKAVSNGLIIEYAVIQGTAVNYGLICFEE